VETQSSFRPWADIKIDLPAIAFEALWRAGPKLYDLIYYSTVALSLVAGFLLNTVLPWDTTFVAMKSIGLS